MGTTIRKKCEHCEKIFNAPVKEVNRGNAKFCSKICGNNHRSKPSTEKQCPRCNKSFIVTSKDGKREFCSRSCANAREHTEETKGLIREAICERNGKYPYCKVSFDECSFCKKAFRKNIHNRKYCSEKCSRSIIFESKLRYRLSCRFDLNKKDHKELFDGTLIAKYGWYYPTNHPKGPNLNGCSWDHLYRIEDGFKNKVPIDIMTHPANAELIPFSVNQHRRKSMITLEELYARIVEWDSGNRKLTKFYKEINE